MKKLLFTHGCSFTFEANDGQIVQTWPTHLFKKLDMEIYNHGIGGFGNHGIFRQTMNWLSSNKDKWKKRWGSSWIHIECGCHDRFMRKEQT